jgi:hypothetical protein
LIKRRARPSARFDCVANSLGGDPHRISHRLNGLLGLVNLASTVRILQRLAFADHRVLHIARAQGAPRQQEDVPGGQSFQILAKAWGCSLSTVIGPQPGPQQTFLCSAADIAIYGGAAGGGKTFAELLEPLRHVGNKDFGAVIFRRTTPQITNEGALWDESLKLYPLLGAKPNQGDLYWTFPSGSTVSFKHLEHDKTVLNWQGSQIPLICFDELTHFTQKQFWYMVSRNRSMCGVRPYIGATCNPDADSWVAELTWWINQETGYPIPVRAGMLRWFIRIGDSCCAGPGIRIGSRRWNSP